MEWLKARFAEKSTAAGLGVILGAVVSMFVPPEWQTVAHSILAACGLGAVVVPTRQPG